MGKRLAFCAFAIVALCACSLPFGLRRVFSVQTARPTVSITESDSIVYFVGSFEDYGGQRLIVGCDSFLYPVDTGSARGGDALHDMRLALEALFDPQAPHDIAEPFDWILDLGLFVESIQIDGGFAEVLLGGRLWGIGSCGDAILEAQIMQTIFQFDEIDRARVRDSAMNLRQITDMSDRFSQEALYNFVYTRADY